MIRQLDSDGNLVLVMSPAEAVSLLPIVFGAGMADMVGLRTLSGADVDVANTLTAAVVLLPDEEIINGLVAPHAEHEDDDLEGLRATWAKVVAETRELVADL